MNQDEIKEKRKRRRRKLIFPLLFILFTLSINAYAWFAFISQATLNVDMSVASWDVDFTENDVVTNSVNVAITDMMPGMLDYNHTVQINNNGEVKADVDYWLTEMKVLGNTINVTNSDQVLTNFRTKYPFVLSITTSSDTINPNSSANFNINLSWEYENTSKYYQLDSLYTYNPAYQYYTKSGSTYTEATVTEDSYPTLRDNLYLYKDDADTYFGEACGKYENDTDLPCIEMKFKVVVQQSSTQ